MSNDGQLKLNIASRSDADFAILELSGPLRLSPGLPALREVAKKVLAQRQVQGLILDVSGVMHADSSGLGELAVVYSFTSQRGCPMRLVGAPPSLLRVFEMTGLQDLFQSVESIEVAKSQMRSVARA